MSTMKRKNLSVHDKLEIIRKLENGLSNKVVSRTYGLSQSTVSTIWKNREKLRIAFEQNKSHVKKIRLCEKNDLDEALIAWFKIKSSENFAMPINGPILKILAEKFAESLGYKGFVCSNGWLNRFKARHQIVFGKPCAEDRANAANDSEACDWLRNKWTVIRADYKRADIFCTEETGLLFKLTPGEMSKFKSETCAGGEYAKDRLTVLVCTNMTGTEKRKLLVVGKKVKSNLLENIKNFPVNYSQNSKSWMTSEIFENAILRWDNELRQQKRKILLLVNKSRAHKFVDSLTNIKMTFFPSCEKLQAMRQGVIHSVKVHYRRLLVMRMLDSVEDNVQFEQSALDALRTLERAWHRVSPKTIRNAFRKAGLAEDASTEQLECNREEIALSKFVDAIDARGLFKHCDQHKMDDYATVDDALVTVGKMAEDDATSESESEDEFAETRENAVVSMRDARLSLLTLTKFAETNSVDEQFIRELNNLKDCFDDFRCRSSNKSH